MVDRMSKDGTWDVMTDFNVDAIAFFDGCVFIIRGERDIACTGRHGACTVREIQLGSRS